MTEEFDDIKSMINSNFGNSIISSELKAKLILEVAERVEYYMENNMELFFNHLYRMDVSESKVGKILYNSDSEESVYISLAKLIVDRQLQRLETKRNFKQDDWIDI
ncbi:MAG: hypothetical protein ACM3PT_08495 [Deltaproteobacteria bacterium]